MRARIDQWRDSLEQLFAATVNQQTLEEAAELMCSVSSVDEGYHVECLRAIDAGINADVEGDNSVINLVNKSGYRVTSTGAAIDLLKDFRAIYLAAYERACSDKGRNQGAR